MIVSDEFLSEYISLYAYEKILYPNKLRNAVMKCLGFKPIETTHLFIYGDDVEERNLLIEQCLND